jgi:hypothetical protein
MVLSVPNPRMENEAVESDLIVLADRVEDLVVDIVVVVDAVVGAVAIDISRVNPRSPVV